MRAVAPDMGEARSTHTARRLVSWRCDVTSIGAKKVGYSKILHAPSSSYPAGHSLFVSARIWVWANAAENPNDTYPYWTECPAPSGGKLGPDTYGFYKGA